MTKYKSPDRINAERAISQLLCLTMGSRVSRETNHVFKDLPKRIELCRSLVQEELRGAADAPNVEAAVSVVQRKLNSLQSLETLVKLINEVEW